jgi:hypothetical protein
VAYFDTTWYTHAGDGSTTGYYAVPKWAASTSTPPGTLRRQLTAPAAGNERVFVATQATTQSTGTVEPTWVITRGGRSATDGNVLWQECTGAAGLNGDLANSQIWVQNAVISIGVTIKNIAGTYLFIAIAAGTSKNTAGEPSWNLTAGATTADGTVTWTCIGLASNFTNWAAPHARLMNAVASTWGVNGNDFYIADNSIEVSATQIIINIGTTTAPSRLFSVDRAAPGTLKAGATLQCTGAITNGVTIGSGGTSSAYVYGFTLIGSGSAGILIALGGNVTNTYRFDTCSFQLAAGSQAASSVSVGSASTGGAAVELVNCTFGFSNVGQSVAWAAGAHIWRNTPDPILISGSVVPTAMMKANQGAMATLLCEGVDFTALGANTVINNSISGVNLTLKNCKLTNVMSAPAATMTNLTVDIIACDSGAKPYRNERYNAHGTLTTSIAVLRTGGAVDGGQAISHFLQGTTVSKPWKPFVSLPLVIWNDVIGVPRTLTLYGVILGTTVLPFNDQFWIDVEYMGSTLTPIASLISTGIPTQLTAHTTNAVADAVSVWTGAGATNRPFSLSVTFTPQQKGYVTVYPKLSGAFGFYLDPKPVLT